MASQPPDWVVQEIRKRKEKKKKKKKKANKKRNQSSSKNQRLPQQPPQRNTEEQDNVRLHLSVCMMLFHPTQVWYAQTQ